MSSRTRRLAAGAKAEAFDWGSDRTWTDGGSSAVPFAARRDAPESLPVPSDPAAVERDAFTKGYAQGERAGAEAAAARADAMLRRLAQTIEEIQALRGDVIRRAERQVVDVALAIARRVVLREVSLDPELVLAMARVALDRLSDTTAASIHLHPDDHAVAVGPRAAATAEVGVQVVADPSVRRGGCVVRSDLGAIDVSVQAQIDEIERALLGDARRPESPVTADALVRA